MEKVKVLLVVGNLDMSRTLNKIIAADHELWLVAEANNAYAARDKIIECEPDVMLLCHDLPRMSGLDFMRRLMPQRPVKTIVIAGADYEAAAYNVGAKDFIAYSDSKDNFENANICQRLKNVSGIGLKHIIAPMPVTGVKRSEKPDIIAMGASTGGTEAMAEVVRSLKKDIPGIVMVQHMPVGFTQMYAQRLDNEGELSVKEAKSGDVVKPGHILLAPGDKQMRIVKVNGMYQVECRQGPKVSGHCPSVDVLFESVARVAGKNAVGVIMTGMGSDGAKGLLAMKRAGAKTIGQDEKSCVVYGMPKVAYELGAVDYQVSLDHISQKIYYLTDRW